MPLIGTTGAPISLPNLVSAWSNSSSLVVAPILQVTPTALAFPVQKYNTPSAPLTLTVSNVGIGTLSISAMTIVGGTAPNNFTVSGNTCTTTLASGATCTVSIVFTPTAAGPLTSTYVINSNDPAHPQTIIPLSGVGAPIPPNMVSPTPGSVLSGATVAFTWTVGSQPVSSWMLYVGTTGVGSSNILKTGSLSATTATATGIPSLGATVYVRLYYLVTGTTGWQSADFTYKEANTAVPAALTSPTPGSVLTGSTGTFTWSTGTGFTGYQLWIGTTGVGSSNLLNTGQISATTTTVTNLPTTGIKVYVRLYSIVGTSSLFTDYTFTAFGSPTPAAITSPTPGTVLPGATTTFNWTTGAGITGYMLYVGTTGAGSSNILNTGSITTTSATVTNLPINGVKVYVRLYSARATGGWTWVDYTYTAF